MLSDSFHSPFLVNVFNFPKCTVFITLRTSAQFLCLHSLLFQLRAYYNTRLQLERSHVLTQ